jgi:hypothetical protein
VGDSGPFLLWARVNPLSSRTPLGGGVLLCVSRFAGGYPRHMGVINKRNAVLGWAVWNASKIAAKRKAKSVTTDGSRRPTKAIAAGLATLGGVVWFWRRRQADSDES